MGSTDTKAAVAADHHIADSDGYEQQISFALSEINWRRSVRSSGAASSRCLMVTACEIIESYPGVRSPSICAERNSGPFSERSQFVDLLGPA